MKASTSLRSFALTVLSKVSQCGKSPQMSESQLQQVVPQCAVGLLKL
jgi:hypothetical protein